MDSVHFPGLAGEFDAELLAAGVEFAEIVDGEAELGRAGGVVVGSGVKREDRVAGRELGLEGRLDLSSRPSLSR